MLSCRPNNSRPLAFASFSVILLPHETCPLPLLQIARRFSRAIHSVFHAQRTYLEHVVDYIVAQLGVNLGSSDLVWPRLFGVRLQGNTSQVESTLERSKVFTLYNADNIM